ncbi:hypothetical protein EJ05DRAFT_358829 [Pseudovirgaria hyperparasitica]|uniref:Uncharacterized protein n=1 Tax=Pseudovirgaria hyperparasitica TaxID=470096 RepID=A0A6A6W6U7_9PEZI|nr:uncharacterized protein EJ05DRAFT_358829 [Pseudovirgaria hyperparasitica]KAF2758608.1 hypothetical protein EJ05DRAFT_358829 [Pseudovirgaria hyperparasitica]
MLLSFVSVRVAASWLRSTASRGLQLSCCFLWLCHHRELYCRQSHSLSTQKYRLSILFGPVNIESYSSILRMCSKHHAGHKADCIHVTSYEFRCLEALLSATFAIAAIKYREKSR